MNTKRSINVWGARARILSRIWICDSCGTKIYCGRLAERPTYRCLCGRTSWQQLDRFSPPTHCRKA